MADNILTTDRASADLDIAAKEIALVKYPRNIITDPSGNDLTPLTDTALRATPVPVSGTVAATGTFWQATQPVSIASWGGLTDAELRASAVPVSAASLPLPTGAATEATLASASAKLPASLGPKAGSASLSMVEATPTTVTIVSLQTNATGATYNAFGSQACEMLDIVNTQPTAVDLEVRRGGSGNTIIVPAGSSRMFVGLANASGLEVRRLDQSGTQITFTAEAIAA